MRNIYLLDPRNFGQSDHHNSFSLEEMSNDIVRFMDHHSITMATIGGHGFGAKLATATAINHLNRFTGVVCFDGGPLDHRYYEAWHEIVDYTKALSKLDLSSIDQATAFKQIDNIVGCPKWAHTFKQNVNADKNPLQWNSNMTGVVKNMNKQLCDLAYWS